MRRLGALLLAAGLAVAPSGVDAGPADTAREETWSSSRFRLGVQVTSLTRELREHFGARPDRGVLVARVDPRSPAAEAGIAVGDVIVEVRGQAIGEANDVVAALATARKGDVVTVQLVRDRKPLTVSAKVVESSAIMNFWPRWFRDFLEQRDPDRATRDS